MTYPMRIAVVGMGLIGGSLAKWIQEQCPDIQVSGVDLCADSLEKAVQDGAIDARFSAIEDIPKPVDIVFVCVPIPAVKTVIETVFAHFGPETIITDVASVKATILDRLAPDVAAAYIPGHPMAGSQFQGYDSAESTIMKGAPYLVVPTENPKWNDFIAFLKRLSFQVIDIPAAAHDHVVGMVSHLGYWVSVGMGQVVAKAAPTDYNLARKVAGPGFYSMIRLCGKDPQWALNVAEHNHQEVVGHLQGLIGHLQSILAALETSNYAQLAQVGEESRRVYDDFYREPT